MKKIGLPLSFESLRREIIGPLMVLLIGGCATASPVEKDLPRPFDRNIVLVLMAPSVIDAGILRQNLLRGEPPPASAKWLPIAELDAMDPGLVRIALDLRECEISTPISPFDIPGLSQFVLLQRGGEGNPPCQPPTPGLTETIKKSADTVGQILVGLLMIGLAALGAAAPFLFDLF